MSETSGEGAARTILVFSFADHEDEGLVTFEALRPPQTLKRLTLPKGGCLKQSHAIVF